MFARSVAVRALRQCAAVRAPSSSISRIATRKFTASAPKADVSAATTHPLAGVTWQLDKIAPRFEVDPSQIEIIHSPTAFYETLKAKILGAKRRIYLSTLYIGKTEHELVNTIKEALQQNPQLQVSILTDALRGTREDPNPSCATLLAPLISSFGDRVEVCMFHTPNLNRWKKKYMPKRINEGWGLQHMKLYGFDDEIIISGANLSDDYFTNRLDRYHLFKSKPLTDHYAAIHNAVCDISYRVIPSNETNGGFELESPLHRGIPDPVWESQKYIRHAKTLLEPLIHTTARQKMFPVAFTKGKTFVYPIAQFDVLLGQPRNIDFMNYEFSTFTSTEKPVLMKLLTQLDKDEQLRGTNWTFTAGYFNIDPEICELLIAAAPAKKLLDTAGQQYFNPCTVITASPWANGFYGSPGVSGMLPAAYTLLSRRFLRAVSRDGKADDIQLKEWRRGTVGEPGAFTYHAKGKILDAQNVRRWIPLRIYAANQPAKPLPISCKAQANEYITTGIWATLPPQPDESGNLVPEPGPSVTLVGSSNYTKRSYSLDLEVGAMVVTADSELKQRLKAETEWLQEDATVTTVDDLMKVERRVGFKVRASLWLVEKLGGAL